MQYLMQNANKFLAAIEWILTLHEIDGRVSYDHYMVLTMMLEALPFSFDSGPVIRRGELWKEQVVKQKTGLVRLGMGLDKSRTKFGYAWLLPLIDWEQMAFKSRIASQVGFSTAILRDTY